MPRDRRPWGWFESLASGDSFQVKRIFVNQGQALSLQSHRHRAEHWIVVAGTATVTIGHEVRQLVANESVYVPLGAVHRLENRGHTPVELIEVLTSARTISFDTKTDMTVRVLPPDTVRLPV
jgi:mannose-6-phosphate isomerase-like protein (cupin superfamily)